MTTRRDQGSVRRRRYSRVATRSCSTSFLRAIPVSVLRRTVSGRQPGGPWAPHLGSFIDPDAGALGPEESLVGSRKKALLSRLKQAESPLRAEYEAVDRLAEAPTYEAAARSIRRWLRSFSAR